MQFLFLFQPASQLRMNGNRSFFMIFRQYQEAILSFPALRPALADFGRAAMYAGYEEPLLLYQYPAIGVHTIRRGEYLQKEQSGFQGRLYPDYSYSCEPEWLTRNGQNFDLLCFIFYLFLFRNNMQTTRSLRQTIF